MIENQIQFHALDVRSDLDKHLFSFFGHKHFHVEMSAGQPISASNGYHASLQQARKLAETRAAKKYVELLRRCYPLKLMNFAGLSKGPATWWTAIVCLADPTDRGKIYNALLIGWTNAKYGSNAIVSYVADSEEKSDTLMDYYIARIEDKESRNYETEWRIDAEDDSGILDLKMPDTLPSIPGLPALTIAEVETKDAVKTKIGKSKKASDASPEEKLLDEVKKKKKKMVNAIKVATEKKTKKQTKAEKEAEKKASLREQMSKRKQSSDW